MTPRTSRTLAVGFAGLGLVGALAGCATGTTTAATSDPSTGTTASTSASDTASASSTYKDGTYTEKGSYLSPAGEETVSVEITLSKDSITKVAVTPLATDAEAKSYQVMFVQGIAAVVVGKDIDAISVSRVAGSSLTSGGFNKAIEAIKADAKA